MITPVNIEVRKANVNNRINEIKSLLSERGIECSQETLFDFFKFCMNFTKMQMWLFDSKLKGKYISDLEIQEKFFSLKTNEEIVGMYDAYLNAPKDEKKDIKKRYIRR